MLKTFLFLCLSFSISFAEEWPVGCWDCRPWGAIRLLDNRYVVYVDPDGNLQNWGVWNYNIHSNRIMIVWMESDMLEIIEKEEDKFFRQSCFPWGTSSEIEETKKIGK